MWIILIKKFLGKKRERNRGDWPKKQTRKKKGGRKENNGKSKRTRDGEENKMQKTTFGGRSRNPRARKRKTIST